MVPHGLLRVTDILLLVQDDAVGLVSDPHPPRGVLGFLEAAAVHGLDGAVGILPPLELSCVGVPLPVAEHDGPVAIPGGGEGRVSWPRGSQGCGCG